MPCAVESSFDVEEGTAGEFIFWEASLNSRYKIVSRRLRWATVAKAMLTVAEPVIFSSMPFKKTKDNCFKRLGEGRSHADLTVFSGVWEFDLFGFLRIVIEAFFQGEGKWQRRSALLRRLSNGSKIAGKDIWRTSAVMPSAAHDVDILRLLTADESSEWIIGKRSLSRGGC